MDFSEIENRLTVILDALADQLSLEERREVVEFIDVGEYGVALETLSALIVEELKTVPPAVYALMVELAKVMGVYTSTITGKLKGQVRHE